MMPHCSTTVKPPQARGLHCTGSPHRLDFACRASLHHLPLPLVASPRTVSASIAIVRASSRCVSLRPCSAAIKLLTPSLSPTTHHARMRLPFSFFPVTGHLLPRLLSGYRRRRHASPPHPITLHASAAPAGFAPAAASSHRRCRQHHWSPPPKPLKPGCRRQPPSPPNPAGAARI